MTGWNAVPVIGSQDGELLLDGNKVFSGSTMQLIARIDALVKSRLVHLVMTPNVDQVINMISGESRRHVRSASLLLADGMPIVGLGRLVGAHLQTRNTGADLLPQVAKAAPNFGWTVAILGGADGAAQLAATSLSSQYGTQVIPIDCPPITAAADDPESPKVIRHLEAATPDVVFICLGSPKQEAWVLEWAGRLPPAVYIGAGAAVDFAAGLRSRCPRFMQRLGLEWLYRLAQEPTRLFRRYIIKGPVFGVVVAKSLYRRRLKRR